MMSLILVKAPCSPSCFHCNCFLPLRGALCTSAPSGNWEPEPCMLPRCDSTSWTKRCCKSVIKVGLGMWNTLLPWTVSEVRNGWGSTYNIWVSHNLTSSFANLNAKGTPYYCIDEFLGFLGASVCFLQLQYGHVRSRNNKLLELVIRVEHDSDDDQLPKSYYIQDYIQTRRSDIFVLSHLLCVFHVAFGDLDGPQIRVCDPCFQHAKPWQRNIYVIFDGLKKHTPRFWIAISDIIAIGNLKLSLRQVTSPCRWPSWIWLRAQGCIPLQPLFPLVNIDHMSVMTWWLKCMCFYWCRETSPHIGAYAHFCPCPTPCS